MTTTLYWCRQDIRQHDNPALTAAIKNSERLLIIYIDDDVHPKQWAWGGASRWWLHHALEDIQKHFQEKGQQVHYWRGDPCLILPALVERFNIQRVTWNRCYQPFAVQRDSALKTTLQERGVVVETFNGGLLQEPWSMRKEDGTPYKVFTPYWKHLQTKDWGTPLPAPTAYPPPPDRVLSSPLASFQFLPSSPDWADGLRATWNIGEEFARERLFTFLDGALEGYKEKRNVPSVPSTSGLSPYLHWGHISPRQIAHAVRQHPLSDTADAHHFLSELAWREFSYSLLFHYPTLPDENWRSSFDTFPWQENTTLLNAWQRGQTGYPIVDAGMRELWRTGWMHNRVRMVVASFLCKHLRLHWRHGEAWFWDTLVDADLANNAASWQWVAGSGADAAPYFRIFNPVTQGQKFDPDGDYVRRWLPELSALPNARLHQPWTASPLERQAGGVRLGETYPSPIVDHAQARADALAAFASLAPAGLR
jgi:deoxyribodipyrimidine photo-lyase